MISFLGEGVSGWLPKLQGDIADAVRVRYLLKGGAERETHCLIAGTFGSSAGFATFLLVHISLDRFLVSGPRTPICLCLDFCLFTKTKLKNLIAFCNLLVVVSAHFFASVFPLPGSCLSPLPEALLQLPQHLVSE